MTSRENDLLGPDYVLMKRAVQLGRSSARVLAHPLLVCLIFPKYFPVRIKHFITENLPTGFDLKRVLFRDTE